MQISALRKLLKLISPKRSRKEKSLSEQATLDAREEDSVQTQSQNLNSDFENQNIPISDRENNEENQTEIFENQDYEQSEEPSDAEGKIHPCDNLPDTKAHLTSSVPRSAKAPIGVLTKQEMGELRAIFSKMDDAEIQRLYKRVTK